MGRWDDDSDEERASTGKKKRTKVSHDASSEEKAASVLVSDEKHRDSNEHEKESSEKESGSLVSLESGDEHTKIDSVDCTIRDKLSDMTGMRSHDPFTGSNIAASKPQLSLQLHAGQCRSVDEYEPIQYIDQGTFGLVYQARCKTSHKIYALKQVKLNEYTAYNGFPITALRECNLLMYLNHPNILKVKEMVIGSTTEKVYMVMEYAQSNIKEFMVTEARKVFKQHLALQHASGPQLSIKHQSNLFEPSRKNYTPFTLANVKTLLIQLLSAIEYCHRYWVIHRDLKTSNLLYTYHDLRSDATHGVSPHQGNQHRIKQLQNSDGSNKERAIHLDPSPRQNRSDHGTHASQNNSDCKSSHARDEANNDRGGVDMPAAPMVGGQLLVGDFGSARHYSAPLDLYTQEVCTLWYRCPSLLLGEKIYGRYPPPIVVSCHLIYISNCTNIIIIIIIIIIITMIPQALNWMFGLLVVSSPNCSMAMHSSPESQQQDN